MRNQGGFTLVEVMIVAAILIPTLGLVLQGTQTVNKRLVVDDSIGKQVEDIQRSVMRLAKLIRPCSLATYRMVADKTDVDAGLAEHVGDWIEPRNGESRTAITFQSADGRLSMNARNLTQPRTIRFVMDTTETPNGLDDDGDGLVDEGRLVMSYEGIQYTMLSRIESCTFQLDDRRLSIEVHSGVKRRGEETQHFTSREILYLRNN